MRFHMTLPFAKAQKAHEIAYAGVAVAEDTLKPGTAEYEAVHTAEYDALDVLMATDAVTPTEIIVKLEHFTNREMYCWKDCEQYLDKIKTDLRHMQGHPVSPAMRACWRVWRVHDMQYDAAARRSETEADAMRENRNKLYAEMAMMHCTTPGDFILKQYFRMLTTHGGQERFEQREDGTDNRWDISLDHADDQARFDRADNLGTYQDLDDCDIGRNLLAYGEPDFHPDLWCDAAKRVGLAVSVVSDGLSLFVNEDEPFSSERIKRERVRLRRILAFGMDRAAMIAEELKTNWPLSAPATGIPVGEVRVGELA